VHHLTRSGGFAFFIRSAQGRSARSFAARRGRRSSGCIKLFTLDISPERVQQLVVELQRLVGAHLTHPALSTPVAAGLQAGSAYFVSDFVAADSLDLVIREYGAAPPNDALRVAAQLAGALDFANAVQVRHGALHPRDVLLSSDETRLTGIGFAQALEAVGMGAPVRRPYTPPERISAGDWGRRSDVFSLAALTHELLWARRVTGTGGRAVENLTPIQGADLNALRAVFARALAEEPSERFETALEFADALRGAFPSLAGTVASAPVISPTVADDGDAARIFPQATQAPKPLEVRPPAERRPVPEEKKPKFEERRPASEPKLPLLDRHGDVDLPLAEIARAENDRYRDVEMAPSIVPPLDARPSAAGAPPDNTTPASRYLDYVRDDQPVPAAEPDLPIAPPIVVRPTLPEPAITREPPPPSRVPLAVALLVGLLLGFGAGYGVGLRQGRTAGRRTAIGRDGSGAGRPRVHREPGARRAETVADDRPAAGTRRQHRCACDAACCGAGPAASSRPGRPRPRAHVARRRARLRRRARVRRDAVRRAQPRSRRPQRPRRARRLSRRRAPRRADRRAGRRSRWRSISSGRVAPPRPRAERRRRARPRPDRRASSPATCRSRRARLAPACSWTASRSALRRSRCARCRSARMRFVSSTTATAAGRRPSAWSRASRIASPRRWKNSRWLLVAGCWTGRVV
jgi:serine/threonine protein kinase